MSLLPALPADYRGLSRIIADYREKIEAHFGDPSTFMQMLQNDFVHIPARFATEWVECCSIMSEFDLHFVTSIFSSVYATSTPDDLYVINSNYHLHGIYDKIVAANEDVSHPIKFSKAANRLTLQEEIRHARGHWCHVECFFKHSCGRSLCACPELDV